MNHWQPGKMIIKSLHPPHYLYPIWPATPEDKEIVEIVDNIIYKMMEETK